ncbi:MAG: tetratricopeptide repeat protein [Magnetococcales bacterium]|nr:tetratricopeptide repeat protein [Magnetococcales bacterium]
MKPYPLADPLPMSDANLRPARSAFRILRLIAGLWLLWLPAPLPAAETNLEETLKSATEALARDALEESERLHGQVINASEATRLQRAAAFGGRCASRYKQALSRNNPALIPQAIDDCDRALELKSDLQQAYRIRGVALLSAGHPDRASEDLSVAVALNPEDHLAYQNRALALAKLGRSREAMTELDVAIRLKPDNPWSYYNRGRLRMAQGEYENAIDDFIAFVRFKRDHEEVYRLRGQSRLWIGQLQAALGDFHEALRLRPTPNPEALQGRGTAYFLLGRLNEAEQDLSQAVQQQPAQVESRLWLFLTRQRLGKPGQELLTDPALKKDPGHWPGALVAMMRGEIPAEKGLEVARASEDPAERRLRENLTLLLLAHQARNAGQKEESTRWLETIQAGQEREAPFHRIARQTLQRAPLAMTEESLPTPAAAAAPATAPAPTATPAPAIASAPTAAPAHATASAPVVTRSSDTLPTPLRAAPSSPRLETRELQTPRVLTPAELEAILHPTPAAPRGDEAGAPAATKSLREPRAKPRSEPAKDKENDQTAVTRSAEEEAPVSAKSKPAPRPTKTAATPTPAAQAAPTTPAPAATAPATPTPAAQAAPTTPAPAATAPATASAGKPGTTAATPAVKPAAASAGKGGYFFKAGSYANTGYANAALTDYLKLGLPAYLEQGKVQDKTVYRVLIGPFDDPAHAEEARTQIRTLPNQNPGEITKR